MVKTDHETKDPWKKLLGVVVGEPVAEWCLSTQQLTGEALFSEPIIGQMQLYLAFDYLLQESLWSGIQTL